MRWVESWLVVVLACSSAEEVPPPGVDPPTVAEPPAGLWATVELGSGALQSLSESLEAPMLRALVPSSPSELVARIEDRPRAIDEQAPVRVAWLGPWDEPRVIVAVGSQGRREVVASDPRLSNEARAWMLTPVEGEGIVVRFEDAAMPELRRALDRALDDQVRMARAGIALEASRHDDPPAYGDPLALVEWLARRLASYIAFVPDVQELSVRVEPRPLRVEGSFRVRQGSPAAEAVGVERVADVPAVPGGSALAWWRAAPRAGWAQLLETTAGDRLRDADRVRLMALAEAPTEGSMLAVGRDTAPFAWLRVPHEAPELTPLLTIPHVRTLLAQFRCERVRPVFGARLCNQGPWLHMRTTDGAYEVSVADRAEFMPAPSSPDAQRVLPRRASGLVMIDAARVAPASGLWRAATSTAPPRETPLAFTWTADAPRVSFELRFAPGSLASLTDAGLAASDP